jgi:hypothetical protein
MDILVFVIAICLFGFGVILGESGNYTEIEFIEKYNKIPYCVETKVGLDKVKKCYIVKEVQ